MRLVLHPKVHSDVHAIMEYYERVAGPELADDFYTGLRRFMLDAAERPESLSIRERDLRRVNLHRFPYHFLFRIAGDEVDPIFRPELMEIKRWRRGVRW